MLSFKDDSPHGQIVVLTKQWPISQTLGGARPQLIDRPFQGDNSSATCRALERQGTNHRPIDVGFVVDQSQGQRCLIE